MILRIIWSHVLFVVRFGLNLYPSSELRCSIEIILVLKCVAEDESADAETLISQLKYVASYSISQLCSFFFV